MPMLRFPNRLERSSRYHVQTGNISNEGSVKAVQDAKCPHSPVKSTEGHQVPAHTMKLLDPYQFYTQSSTIPLVDHIRDTVEMIAKYRDLEILKESKDQNLQIICKSLNSIAQLTTSMNDILPMYDACPESPGNGYRSLIFMTARYLNSFLKETGIGGRPSKLFARPTVKISSRVTKAYIVLFDRLHLLLDVAQKMDQSSGLNDKEDVSLFATNMSVDDFQPFLDIDVEIFYGDHFGIPLPKRLRLLMSGLLDASGSLVKGYHSHDNQTLMEVRGYMGIMRMSMQHHLRAKRIACQMAAMDPAFVKLLWNQTECSLFNEISSIGAPLVAVNRLVSIKTHPLQMIGRDGSIVVVQPPVGVETITIRIISYDPLSGDLFKRGYTAHHTIKTINDHSEIESEINKTDKRKTTLLATDSPRTPRKHSNGSMFSKLFLHSSNKKTLPGDGPNDHAHIDHRLLDVGSYRSVGQYYRSTSHCETTSLWSASQSSGPSRSAKSFDGILSINRNTLVGRTFNALPNGKPKPEESKVKGFLYHIHGGGFVAQTSYSHVPYLKDWAKEMRIPIISVDYPLSPKVPFGPALDVCHWGYCWAVNNASLLGISPETVCLSGDSAGGNFVVATTIKIIEGNLRLPDAIQCNYPALHIRLTPAPARLLAAGDALLGLGALRTCMRAYGGSDCELADPATINPLLSPWHAQDEILKRFPPIYMVCGAMDPLLDDGVDFARKLIHLGVKVKLEVVPSVSHAFLQLLGGGKYTDLAYKVARDHACMMFNPEVVA